MSAAECQTDHSRSQSSSKNSACSAGTQINGASIETVVDDAGSAQQRLTLQILRIHNGRALSCEATNAYGSSVAFIPLRVQCKKLIVNLKIQ